MSSSSSSSSSTSGSPYVVDEESHASLMGKVVVISGGANGIGAALARHLHALGCTALTIGDVDAGAGAALAASLPGTTFVRADVRRYADVVALFRTARATYGRRVGAAVASAGVFERGDWFAQGELTPEGVGREVADEATVGVNLMGGLYFARVAMGYLAEKGEDGEDGDRALVFVGSSAAFRENPGTPVYATTKTGLLGLARNLALTLHPTTGVRTNIVLPAMTETAMVGPAAQLFRAAGLAVNSAADVARFLVDMLARDERDGKPLNGLAVYVEGGRGWEIEEGLKRTMAQWLGEEPTARIEEDHKVMKVGMWKE